MRERERARRKGKEGKKWLEEEEEEEEEVNGTERESYFARFQKVPVEKGSHCMSTIGKDSSLFKQIRYES